MIVQSSKLLEACCICLGENLDSRHVSYKYGDENWITKLRFCLEKIIWSSDYVICVTCSEQLDIVYDFHQLCHSSNEKRQLVLKEVLFDQESKDTEDSKKKSNKSSVYGDSLDHLFCEHCNALRFQNQLELQEHYTHVHSNLNTVEKNVESNNVFTSDAKLRYKHKLNTKCECEKDERGANKKCNNTTNNLCQDTSIDNVSIKHEPGDIFVKDTILTTHLNPKVLPPEAQSYDSQTSNNCEAQKGRTHDNMCKETDNYATSKCKRRCARRRNSSKPNKSTTNVTENCKRVGKKEKNQSVEQEKLLKSDEALDNDNETQPIDSLDFDSNNTSADNNSDVDLEDLDNSNGVPSTKGSKNTMIFTCDLCESTFTLCIKLMEHAVSVHNLNEKDVRPYACAHCPKRFNKHSTLKDHAKSHDPVRNEMCSFCGKAFKTKRALTIHEKQHLNLREYQCPHCPKRFNTHKNRNTHIYILHSDPQTWKHVCNICEKKFALKTTYIAHMRIHSTFKQFACHLCDKRFTDRTTLRNHLTSHSNVREHKCSECGNEYKNIKYLKVHMAKAHSIGNIKLPVRAKKHFCHMCPKAFCYKNKLLRHIYTHTGERPFPCNVCDKRFTDKSYAVQHMKSIHNILPDTTDENL